MYCEFVLKAKIEKQLTIESLQVFASNYRKIKAVAISPSTAICPWNLFCRDHSRVFI